MGLPVTTVASGGLPVVETTRGTPVTEAANARGVPVTKIVGKPYGLPVTFETIGVAPASDPFWSNVLLLCDFEGADASTSFVDSSSYARTLTAVGGAKISTAQFKFGTSSYLGGGSLDAVSVPDSNDWNLSTLTMEAWIRSPFGGSSQAGMIASHGGVNGSWSWAFFTTKDAQQVGGWFSTVGTDTPGFGGTSLAMAPNTWHYVVMTRNASNLARVFLNGVMVASSTMAGNFNSTSVMNIGGWSNGAQPAYSHNGWIDSLRISNIDRYDTNSNIPVPTAPFPRGP